MLTYMYKLLYTVSFGCLDAARSRGFGPARPATHGFSPRILPVCTHEGFPLSVIRRPSHHRSDLRPLQHGPSEHVTPPPGGNTHAAAGPVPVRLPRLLTSRSALRSCPPGTAQAALAG